MKLVGRVEEKIKIVSKDQRRLIVSAGHAREKAARAAGERVVLCRWLTGVLFAVVRWNVRHHGWLLSRWPSWFGRHLRVICLALSVMCGWVVFRDAAWLAEEGNLNATAEQIPLIVAKLEADGQVTSIHASLGNIVKHPSNYRVRYEVFLWPECDAKPFREDGESIASFRYDGTIGALRDLDTKKKAPFNQTSGRDVVLERGRFIFGRAPSWVRVKTIPAPETSANSDQ